MPDNQSVLELQVAGGIKLAVPATLDSITTYVLLEQESWFEKEPLFLRYWMRPGMTAIDIGASVGIYSLLMARRVGSQGRVFAYEPASEPRALLERNRSLNDAAQIQVFPFALSDSVREGHLVFGPSSEFNALGSSGAGERVGVSTLDVEDAERGWPAPDFVKIDVEGEEEAILRGGRQFFERYSPLVMFEIKSGTTFKENLRTVFPAMGYRLYRQMGAAPILLPLHEQETIEPHELNAFAAKPDRAAALAREGFLVETIGDWVPTEETRAKGLAVLRRQSFSKAFKPLFAKDVVLESDYRDALAGYAAWRNHHLLAADRCAALAFALQTLRKICERAPTAERLSTLVRAASDWGARGESIKWAGRIAAVFQQGPLRLREPFWPASASLDSSKPSGPADLWLFGAAVEHIERSQNYSSMFTGATATLGLVCGLPGVPIEMERRRTLVAALLGQRPKVPQRLRVAAPDHLNADVWAAGKVPGTAL